MFKQLVKGTIHPSKSEVKQVIEAILTPTHPHTFKSLLNKPFTDTFDHSTSNRSSHLLVAFIVNMIAMGFQVGDHIRQGLAHLSRQRWRVLGVP